jgi:hypothetical protein
MYMNIYKISKSEENTIKFIVPYLGSGELLSSLGVRRPSVNISIFL